MYLPTFITVHIFSADICKICVYSLCLAFQFAVSEYGLDKVSFSRRIESERVRRPARKRGVKCEGCLCAWGSWQDFGSVEMEIRSRRPPSCRKNVCRDWPSFKIATSIYSPSLFTRICFVTLSPPFARTDSLKQSNLKRLVEMELIDESAGRFPPAKTMKRARWSWNRPNLLIESEAQCDG